MDDDQNKQFWAEQEKLGKVLQVPSGTAVRLVRAFDAGDLLATAEVEVVEGPLKGRYLFVGSMLLGPPGEKPLKKYEGTKGYSPRVGDRVVIYQTDKTGEPFRTATVADGASSYGEYWKALDIKDNAGLKELEERTQVLEVEVRTKVLVLELHDYETEDPRADAAEVRILEGPHSDKRLWVEQFTLKSGIPGLEEEPNPPQEERRVHVTLYHEPTVGEKVVVGSRMDAEEGSKGLKNTTHEVATRENALLEIIRARLQGKKELAEQIHAKCIFTIPVGTQVQVLAADLKSTGPFRYAKVRVLSGAHRDKIVWTSLFNLMVPDEWVRAMEARGAEVTLEQEGADVNTRAAARMDQAKVLEKINKRGDISHYRGIIKDFPGTVQAKEAQERISALEKMK